jgi:hypothetical protein
MPISIAGKPVLAGVKDTTKTASGNAFDTGATQLGRVVLAPWSTNVGPNQASSSSALATAALNNVGDVAVAPSSSFATWTPGASNSSAVSDGAIVHLGSTTIKVLHSESNSSGKGRTYLVQINDTILGATDASGCMVDLGPVATLGCLKVLGGTGSSAAVVQALIGQNAPFGKIVAAAASGGVAQTASAVPSSVLGTDLSRGTSKPLARTGMNILELVAFGMFLSVLGATAVFASERKLSLVPAKVAR